MPITVSISRTDGSTEGTAEIVYQTLDGDGSVTHEHCVPIDDAAVHVVGIHSECSVLVREVAAEKAQAVQAEPATA